MNIDELLSKVKCKPDAKSHLIPNDEICLTCNNRICEFVCPANVYEWDESLNKLHVAFENCLECGACRIACPHKAIEWNYPDSDKGIVYKNS